MTISRDPDPIYRCLKDYLDGLDYAYLVYEKPIHDGKGHLIYLARTYLEAEKFVLETVNRLEDDYMGTSTLVSEGNIYLFSGFVWKIYQVKFGEYHGFLDHLEF